LHDPSGQFGRRRVVRERPVGEEVAEMAFRLVKEAWDERVEVGIGLDLGAVEIEFSAPD
jgi:hypothetical protein